MSSSVIFRQYGVSQSECKIDRPRPGLPRISPCPHTEALGTRLQRGFIEKIPDSEKIRSRCHYLPHHAILKDSSTTPLLVVFDCSCKTGDSQPSLNFMNFMNFITGLYKLLVNQYFTLWSKNIYIKLQYLHISIRMSV
jgi:hypothetical protein